MEWRAKELDRGMSASTWACVDSSSWRKFWPPRLRYQMLEVSGEALMDVPRSDAINIFQRIGIYTGRVTIKFCEGWALTRRKLPE